MRTQQHERAHGIGAAQGEGLAFFQRQRFRQDKISVDRIGQAQSGRDPKRQPRIGISEQAAQRRAQDEPDPERRANHAKRPRPFFRFDHVRDIGRAGRDAGRRDSRNDAPDKKPGQRRRQRHDDVIETEAEVRKQDHRPPPKAVRQHAEHRREDELHQGPDRAENAKHLRRVRRVAAEKIEHQIRQDRRDQPSASMSSVTVMKIKMTAALRGFMVDRAQSDARC